jgi:ribosome-binding ATPase YchF (GTP1/OBG family)
MSRRLWIFSLLAVLTAVVGVYISSSSSNEVVVDESGVIDGALNNARAVLQGRRFWENQRQQAQVELNRKIAQPALLAKHMADLAKAKQTVDMSMEKQYAKHPELRPPMAQAEANALRELADQVEQAEFWRLVEMDRLKRIAALQNILIAIEAHLASLQ